jgi:rhodanese-related sulfurtransferase
MRLSLEASELAELVKADTQVCLIDVRKQPARAQRGLQIQISRRELPFETDNWWQRYTGRRVVVYCVHGHEVSRNACAVLRGKGIDARYLDGGFEGWREAGQTVEALGEGDVA